MAHKDFNHYYLEMQEHFLYVPYLHQHRRIRVLLPKDYRADRERYPVLYMHDGQNVFYSKESYSGHSWKIIPTINIIKSYLNSLLLALIMRVLNV